MLKMKSTQCPIHCIVMGILIVYVLYALSTALKTWPENELASVTKNPSLWFSISFLAPNCVRVWYTQHNKCKSALEWQLNRTEQNRTEPNRTQENIDKRVVLTFAMNAIDHLLDASSVFGNV